MKLLIAALLLLGSHCAAAQSLYLVSDPYPLTGPQPASFNVQLDVATGVSVPAFVNTNGSRQVLCALSGFVISDGSHKFTVTAVSPIGVSTPATYTFTWPLLPGPPVNLRILSQ